MFANIIFDLRDKAQADNLRNRVVRPDCAVCSEPLESDAHNIFKPDFHAYLEPMSVDDFMAWRNAYIPGGE